MAEAIGLVASIITISGAGIKLAQKLYEYEDSVSSSSKRLHEVSTYVRSTAVVIEEIGKVFEEEKDATRKLISQNAIDTVRDVVQECSQVFERLQAALDTAKDGGGLGRLLFPLRESRLVLLQTNLERLKSTLQCLMQVIVYARLKADRSDDINDTEQRNLIRELISLRQQAAETYERSKREGEEADDAGDERHRTAISLSAINTFQPSSQGNVSQNSLGNQAKENGGDENPTLKEPKEVREIHDGAIPPGRSGPDDIVPNATADCCNNPPISSPRFQPVKDSSMMTSFRDIEEDIPETNETRSKGQPRERTAENQSIGSHSDNRNANDILVFCRMFGDALRFVCCCPCLYLRSPSGSSISHLPRFAAKRYGGSFNGEMVSTELGINEHAYPEIPGEHVRDQSYLRSTFERDTAMQFSRPLPPVEHSTKSKRLLSWHHIPPDPSIRMDVHPQGSIDTDEIEGLLRLWTNLYDRHTGTRRSAFCDL